MLKTSAFGTGYRGKNLPDLKKVWMLHLSPHPLPIHTFSYSHPSYSHLSPLPSSPSYSHLLLFTPLLFTPLPSPLIPFLFTPSPMLLRLASR